MRRLLAGLLVLALPLVAAAQQAPSWRSYGPFSGFVGSTPRHAAPLGAIVDGDSSRNFLYDATERKLYRRKGTSNLDSNFVEAASATWNARARQVLQIELPQLTYPTVAGLYNDTADTLGTLIWRGASASYQLGADREFCWNDYTGDAAKPNVDGQSFIMTPLWTENGLTRAQTAAQRSWLAAGSRKAQVSGNWLFLPNADGTPAMWSMRYGTGSGACQTSRLRPWGHAVPMFPPDFPAASYPSRGAANAEKAWAEGDKFWASVIFQFEDGSYSSPVIPDLTTVGSGVGGASGYVVVNDDGDNDDEYFDYIPWRNIPVGPYGTVARILCRSTKTSKDTEAVPGFRDLRITAVIPNNTQTFYDDPNGDDNALVVNNEIVRFDHVWPRRARYVIANDARLVVGGAARPSPAAFFLAPTGNALSRDLNNNTTTGVGYTDADSMNAADIIPTGVAFGYSVVRHASDPAQDSLYLWRFVKTSGYTRTAFALRGYRSIRLLVEAINATSTASNAKEWAAQVVPGADDEAPGWRLKSTVSFYSGDSTRFLNIGSDRSSGTNGIVWVRSPSWPGVVYFDDDLNDDFARDHQSVWFTGSSPGHAHSAALNFYLGNRRSPPSRAVGKFQGGGAVNDRFVLAYEHAIYVLKNVRPTGADDDYRMVPLNESRGCVSWSSITTGDGWVGYMTRDGYVVTDSENEILISRDVWNREKQTGEWAYEMRKSILATAADTDDTHFHAAVLGSQLHIAYRKDTTATVVDRRLVYDFSASHAASGLNELLSNGQPFGWSTPLTTRVSAMGEAVVDAGGPYRLGAIEATARGRLDKFDTGTSDVEGSIRAVAHTPTDFAETYNHKSAEQLLAVYKKPVAGLSVSYYRDNSRTDAYTTTLASSSGSIFTRQVADLAQAARGATPVFELKIVDHSTGEGSEIWTLALKYRVLDTVR